jgi:hypothetical protein
VRKLGTWLLLIGILTSACKTTEEGPLEQIQEPVCGKSLNSSCMPITWNILVDKSQFPANAEVIINGKKAMDECDRDARFHVNRSSATFVEITLWNYGGLSKDQATVNLVINDRKTCYEQKTLYFSRVDQKLSFEQVDGKKRVIIKIGNN